MKRLGLATTRWVALLAFLSCRTASSFSASPLTDLVVFGDSLSDVGNISSTTLGSTPGAYYFNGRFSNGPVWVESLALNLGLGALTRSSAGGDDFAYGGAQTTGSGGLAGLFIRDLDEQVTQFLGSRSANSSTLYVVFAGANDLLGGRTNVAAPAASLAADVNRLIASGARQFLVPNLPLLGFTPRFNGDQTQLAIYNARTTQFNAAVDAQLASLAATNLQLTFHRFDVAALFNLAIENPTAFGLTNVASSAAPGLVAGAVFYDASRIAPRPNEHLFWDDVHPTAAVHALLAQYAQRLLSGIEGDFNSDGVVAAADLALWTGGLGVGGNAVRRQGDANGDQSVDGADLLAWQRNLGTNVISLPTIGGTQSVPEVMPRRWIWWAMLFVLGRRSWASAPATF